MNNPGHELASPLMVMPLSHTPNLPLVHRGGVSVIAKQVTQRFGEVEARVEPVSEGTKVVVGIHAELEGLVGAVTHRLEVVQDAVDSGARQQLVGLALGHYDIEVSSAGIDDAGKESQSVVAHVGSALKAQFRPDRNVIAAEAGHGRDLQLKRMANTIGLYGRHDGHLVGRATPAYDSALAAEVGFIALHVAAQEYKLVVLGHSGHELAMDELGRTIADAQVTLQGQRGQARLVLADEEHRREPGAQRQFGVVERRAVGQQCLMPAATALEQTTRVVANDIVRRRLIARAAKAQLPTQDSQRCNVFLFGAVALEKLGLGHPGLELDSVHRHRELSGWIELQSTEPLGQGVSLPEPRD